MVNNQFKGKRVAVLNFGLEGISSAQFLKEQGATIDVHDKRSPDELDEKAAKLLKNLKIEYLTGDNYLKNLSSYDYIVRSPGVNKNLPAIVEAVKKGVILTSQTKIFFDLCPCPIIGVTGTKGKGTTSTLIFEMLKKSFDSAQDKRVYLGGNIGNPPFSFLKNLTADSWVVLELSSFQLHDLTKSPHIGVLLMMTSEHQNYHGGINDYIDAKRNLVRYQKQSDYAILNRDYPASNESDIHTEGKVYFVSRERAVEKGCYLKDEAIWIKTNDKEEKIIDTKKILLPGLHNIENACSASMAAFSAGVSIKNIAHVLSEFKGLEHRIEEVATINGALYYNDSFSTTPEAAIAAIEAFDTPEILIVGGSSKNSDFTELGEVIRNSENIKAIIGIGSEWSRIHKAIGNLDERVKIIEDCTNMREIVSEASKIAQIGDVILLSPGCASFGMFKNYKDRGLQFKTEVKKLSGE